MRKILSSIAINGVGLFVLSLTVSGVKITGGLPTFIFGAFTLSLMSFLLKPILNLLALPLNLVTFGTFSFLTNAIILYLLTAFVPQISINSFIFKGFSAFGFVIPEISFNAFFAYIVSSFVLSVILSLIRWLINK